MPLQSDLEQSIPSYTTILNGCGAGEIGGVATWLVEICFVGY